MPKPIISTYQQNHKNHASFLWVGLTDQVLFPI